jgi:hypothetical protein
MRIIFVPQYPSKLRYQEWWYVEFPKEFEKRGFEVVTLGKNYLNATKSSPEMFSPINEAIEFECQQVKEYMETKIYSDDILFLSDISFPGIFPSVLYHKRCKKQYAFCHATSVNNFDYYYPVKNPKFATETALSTLFDKVFVGSYYHREKLINHAKELSWHNTVVTRLPFPPFKSSPNTKKSNFFCSASRPTKQKVNLDLEIEIESFYRNRKIYRFEASSWEDYYTRLSSCQYLLITSSEETFGYQVVDAIINNCIPIAPKAFSYPELLPEEYLYPQRAAASKIVDIIGNVNSVPELNCKREMELFYDKIVYEMRG